jgi:hypothetical protein
MSAEFKLSTAGKPIAHPVVSPYDLLCRDCGLMTVVSRFGKRCKLLTVNVLR